MPSVPKASQSLKSERGTNPASVLIVMLLVLLIFELVAVSGRLVAAKANVQVAAREAARRGTLVQNVHEVNGAVNAAGMANLAAGDIDCISSSAYANVGSVGSPNGQFFAGGSVTATVSCLVDLSDLSSFGVPLPNISIRAEHTEIVETYRAIGEP